MNKSARSQSSANHTKARKADQSSSVLLDLRKKIDKLDQAISALIVERLSLARLIGDIKLDLDHPIGNAEREDAILRRVSAVSPDAELAERVRNVYKVVLEQSRQIQLELWAMSESKDKNFPSLLIIGLGLIGGALAYQIKKNLPATEIFAVDKSEVLQQATADKVISAGYTDASQVISQVPLIILAAPPNENLKLLTTIAPLLSQGQLVVDVTSSKVTICREAENLDLGGANFIGGHPFFGSEKSGFLHAKEVPVDGKTFCLTPCSQSSEISLRKLSDWLVLLNFNVYTVDAQLHDAFVARVSHLIQIIAIALGAQLTLRYDESHLKSLLPLTGPSFQQLSRLMGSPWDLWRQIIFHNRAEVGQAVADLVKTLTTMQDKIKFTEIDNLEEEFRLANSVLTQSMLPPTK